MREAWKTGSLGDLCEVEGGDAAPQNEECFAGGTIPFVRMKDLGRYHFTNNLDKTDDKLTPEAIARNRMKLFDPGCILFPRSGSVALNHRAILGVRACIVSHIGVLRSFSPTIAASYLYRFLQTFDMTSLSKKTTGVDSIAFSDVKRIKVPVPPLAEQERIVKLLDAAGELQRLRAEADRRTADLIPALFHEMFAESEAYPSRKLSSLCEFITKGTTPKSAEIREVPSDGDIPFLKVYHIMDDGRIDFDSRPSFVSRPLHDGLLARSKVYPGDVLMNIVGPPLGKIGLVPSTHPEWNINQALAIFRPKGEILSLYLLYAMRSAEVLSSILSQAVGVRQLNLNLEQCRNASISVPPLPRQLQFDARVSEIRALESRQAESRRRLDDLFQSLLHRAFQGEL